LNSNYRLTFGGNILSSTGGVRSKAEAIYAEHRRQLIYVKLR
jgi:hypothetical protein